MSDSHTDDTSEFNNYIVTVGNYNKIDAFEFKKDIKLQRLLNMFFFRLEDEVFTQEKFANELKNYFDEKHYDKPEDAFNKTFGTKNQQMDGHALRELFKIKNLNTAMSIYCDDYNGISLSFSNEIFEGIRQRATEYCVKQYPTKYNQCLKNMLGKIKRPSIKKIIKTTSNIKKLKKDVEDWHQYCIAINQAEEFIIKRYKGWGSEYSKANRRKANKELEILSEQLKVFDNNQFNSMALYDISKVNKYRFNSLKIENLLSYNLPNIDKAKAKLITENLTSPYSE